MKAGIIELKLIEIWNRSTVIARKSKYTDETTMSWKESVSRGDAENVKMS